MKADTVATIDTYPYRHKVGELMTPEPVFVAPDAPLVEAARTMSGRGISSVLVDRDGVAGGPGIITERDVMRRVAGHGAAALEATCGAAMSAPLAGVVVDDLLHVAIGRMTRLGLRHLVVFDPAGAPCGILTARTLLRHRSSAALVLGDELEAAGDVAGLKAAHDRLAPMAGALRREGVPPRQIAAVIASFYRGLTRRATELAEEGEAPPRYAVLVLGSGGRGESLLAGDQDNAIVHDLPDGADDAVLERIASRMSAMLDEAGLPFCKGGVMASRVPWRRSLADWRRTIAGWAARADEESLLNVDIFFDGVGVHGDMALADALRESALAEARRPVLPRMMAEQVRGFRPPLGLFGGLKTFGGRIDLKVGGLFPLVAGARAMALRHGIAATGTRDRLTDLAQRGLIAPDDAAIYSGAHDLLLGILLDQQIDDIGGGLRPSSLVDPERLDRDRQRRLRATLRTLSKLPGLVADVAAAG